jgi:hypothetical protein
MSEAWRAMGAQAKELYVIQHLEEIVGAVIATASRRSGPRGHRLDPATARASPATPPPTPHRRRDPHPLRRDHRRRHPRHPQRHRSPRRDAHPLHPLADRTLGPQPRKEPPLMLTTILSAAPSLLGPPSRPRPSSPSPRSSSSFAAHALGHQERPLRLPAQRGPDLLGPAAVLRGRQGLRLPRHPRRPRHPHPLFETVDRMDLTNMIIELQVKNAYSKGGIPLNVQGRRQHQGPRRGAAAQQHPRALPRPSREEIMKTARETLEGNLRGVLATLTPEQVNRDKQPSPQPHRGGRARPQPHRPRPRHPQHPERHRRGRLPRRDRPPALRPDP